MKRLNRKSVLLAAVALLLGGGAYLNYMQAQRAAESQMSDLTLANLEAMAWDLDDPNNPDYGAGFEGTCAFVCPGPCSVKCPNCGALHLAHSNGCGTITGGNCGASGK